MEATLGERVAACALELVGTPFRHQGRQPGRGLDCVGVVLAALERAGAPFRWPVAYRFDPDPDLLLEALGAGFAPCAVPEPGDVLAFRLDGPDSGPKHVGIACGPGRMVHVYGRTSRVRLESTSSWAPKLHSIWRRTWPQ